MAEEGGKDAGQAKLQAPSVGLEQGRLLPQGDHSALRRHSAGRAPRELWEQLGGAILGGKVMLRVIPRGGILGFPVRRRREMRLCV